MSQIEELQSRITRALDRIGQGLDAMAGPAMDVDVDALRQRAEAAEEALGQAQDALETLRSEMEEQRDAAVQSVREELTAEMVRQVALATEVQPAQPSGSEADASELQAALEDEKMANAQLEERVRVLKERLSAAEDAAAPAEAAPVDPAALVALDAELTRLRTANADLSASNAALREANAQGVGEPELINQSMAAELNAMRAARATDAAEAGAVLAALHPLLAQAGSQGDV